MKIGPLLLKLSWKQK